MTSNLRTMNKCTIKLHLFHGTLRIIVILPNIQSYEMSHQNKCESWSLQSITQWVPHLLSRVGNKLLSGDCSLIIKNELPQKVSVSGDSKNCIYNSCTITIVQLFSVNRTLLETFVIVLSFVEKSTNISRAKLNSGNISVNTNKQKTQNYFIFGYHGSWH